MKANIGTIFAATILGLLLSPSGAHAAPVDYEPQSRTWSGVFTEQFPLDAQTSSFSVADPARQLLGVDINFTYAIQQPTDADPIARRSDPLSGDGYGRDVQFALVNINAERMDVGEEVFFDGLHINYGTGVELSVTRTFSVAPEDFDFGSEWIVVALTGDGICMPACDSGLWTVVPEIGQSAVALATYKYQAVPIPAAAWLFGSSLLGLMAVRKRRGNAAIH